MGAARHVLSSTLNCTAGVAPPKFDEQSTLILESFLYRKTEHIRSEAASEGILSSRRGSVARASEHGFRTYINGDKTLDAPWHWCNGCCIDPSTGVTTRTQQVEKLSCGAGLRGIIWRQPLGSSTFEGEVVIIEYFFMCRGVRSLGTRFLCGWFGRSLFQIGTLSGQSGMQRTQTGTRWCGQRSSEQSCTSAESTRLGKRRAYQWPRSQ